MFVSCVLSQQLSDMIPKSVVGVLSEDSKNVVDLINNAYRVSCQLPLSIVATTLLLCICETF